MPDRAPRPGSPASRPPLNPAGSPIADLSKLINAYAKYGGEVFTTYLPLAIITILLVVIMLLAAYSFIKD